MARDDRLIWIDLEMTGLVPERDQRQQEDGADREAFRRIRGEERGRRAVEPEARLDAERAPGVERQRGDGEDEQGRADGRDAPGDAREPGLRNRGVDGGEAAAERQDGEEGGARDALDGGEASPRDGVVGGSRVLHGQNRTGERRGHALALPAHGAHLPRVQPELDAGLTGESDDEKERERMHGAGRGAL